MHKIIRIKIKQIFFSLLLLSTNVVFAQTVEIDINPSEKYQVIEGFGASDAWSTEVVGASFSDARKETAAKWLFSPNLSSKGEKEGIGLSIWRFCFGPFGNMPAGSAVIPQDYLDADGNYVWDVNPGKQWFLDRALSYGCDQIGAWSACILPQLRTTGINQTSFRNYGIFLADVLKHYIDGGYKFKYIAPVNEPQYDWTSGEVKWTSSNIAGMTREVSKALIEKGVDTPIFLGEAADWSNLYDLYDVDSHWARNQIYNFFDSKSSNYVGGLPNLLKEFGVHSYWTDQSAFRLKDFRTKAKTRSDSYGIKLHQTEWSLLSNPPIEGLPDAPSDMDIAMILAKVMFSDLYYAGVSSWVYWEAFGAGDDAKFHLIQTTPSKTLTARKNLWVLGNYSLFIRPGYTRISLNNASDLNGLMATAYIDEEESKIVSVYVNMGAAVNVNPQLKLSENQTVTDVKKYVTSTLFNLQLVPVSDPESISIPSRSVVTIIHNIDSSTDVKHVNNDNFNIVYNNRDLHINYEGRYESLKLYNTAGVLLLSTTSNERTLRLSNNIGTGVYIVQLNGSFGTKTAKVVIR